MKQILTLLSCFVVIAFGNSNGTASIKTFEPGDTAPSFNLKNIYREMVSPEDYPDAKDFIVVFTAIPVPMHSQMQTVS